jgi:predicted secreted hydrolase
MRRGLPAFAALAVLVGLEPRADSGPANGGASPVTAPEAGAAGYARALAPRPFIFPRDHGAHPEFRNEWWYLTGNLTAEDGRRFGYQWVIFRLGLEPGASGRASEWATRQAYAGHFAITDVDGDRFVFHERLARGAAGLAGAWSRPLNIWLEDWSLQGESDGWRLRAGEADGEVELELRALKPPVANGEGGLSRKSAEPGNASYYYSVSRLDTHGILRLADRSYRVSGLSWLDREWSTSALAADQQGWDWFALQLDDGTDVMFYHLRRRDGTADPHSQGTFIDRAGIGTRLAEGDVRLTALDTWQSPRGARYPSRWRLSIPSRALTLEVRPVIADQELDVSVRYWEGAVEVTGRQGNHDIRGRGYVELVGYGSGVPGALR